MNDNILSIKAHVAKKDLEAFSQALMEQTIALQIENQRLKEKLEHLEELLKNSHIVTIGKKE
jgi:regulator of replication initiation timing